MQRGDQREMWWQIAIEPIYPGLVWKQIAAPCTTCTLSWARILMLYVPRVRMNVQERIGCTWTGDPLPNQFCTYPYYHRHHMTIALYNYATSNIRNKLFTQIIQITITLNLSHERLTVKSSVRLDLRANTPNRLHTYH